MKVSFCSVAFRKTPASIADIIPSVAGIGYDAVEIWANHLIDEFADAARVRALVDQHDLPVAMISPYFDFTSDEETWRRSVDTAGHYIDCAVTIGSPTVRAFTGVVGSADATPDQWRACVAGLKELGRAAAGAGVTIAVETHPKTLVDEVPAALRLLGDVGLANVQLNLDIYHMWEAHADPLWVLDQLYPFVAHVHAKNAVLNGEPSKPYPFLHDRQAAQRFTGITYLNDGPMPYEPFLSELERRGYEGYVSVEWFGDNVVDAARHELDWLRRIGTSLSEPSAELSL